MVREYNEKFIYLGEIHLPSNGSVKWAVNKSFFWFHLIFMNLGEVVNTTTSPSYVKIR